jgi:hypothetical protein
MYSTVNDRVKTFLFINNNLGLEHSSTFGYTKNFLKATIFPTEFVATNGETEAPAPPPPPQISQNMFQLQRHLLSPHSSQGSLISLSLTYSIFPAPTSYIFFRYSLSPFQLPPFLKLSFIHPSILSFLRLLTYNASSKIFIPSSNPLLTVLPSSFLLPPQAPSFRPPPTVLSSIHHSILSISTILKSSLHLISDFYLFSPSSNFSVLHPQSAFGSFFFPSAENLTRLHVV